MPGEPAATGVCKSAKPCQHPVGTGNETLRQLRPGKGPEKRRSIDSGSFGDRSESHRASPVEAAIRFRSTGEASFWTPGAEDWKAFGH